MGARVLFIFGLLIYCQQTFSQNVLFEEQFSKKDDSKWLYDMQGSGSFTIAGKLELAISRYSSKDAYNNAAIVSKTNFSRKNLAVHIKTSPKEKGSRGWGYWNGEMDPGKSAIAWFIYLEGDSNYPLNGFFAVVQKPGTTPEFIMLDSDLMTGSHEYSISWSEVLEFKIDGTLVAKISQNIPVKMAIHIWQDNAVYDFQTFTPVFQNLSTDAPISVTKVQVLDERG